MAWITKSRVVFYANIQLLHQLLALYLADALFQLKFTINI